MKTLNKAGINPSLLNIVKPCSCALILATSQLAYAECSPIIIEATPTARFTAINGGGEVKDTVTGLIWQRCAIGQVWNQNTCSAPIEAKTFTWHEALKEAKALGNGYRLPNIRELHSIVEPRCHKPSINSTVFPNTVSGTFWSSTPVGYSAGAGWYVDFNTGDSHMVYGNSLLQDGSSHYVRAVRSE